MAIIHQRREASKSGSKAAVPQDLAQKWTGEKLEKEEQRNAKGTHGRSVLCVDKRVPKRSNQGDVI